MKHPISALIAVLTLVFSLAALQGGRADEVIWPEASGKVVAVYRDTSTIVIRHVNQRGDLTVTIGGFPFCYVEEKLSDLLKIQPFEISEGDCAAIEYANLNKNIAVALTGFCQSSTVTDTCDCLQDSRITEDVYILLRDEDFKPIREKEFIPGRDEDSNQLSDNQGQGEGGGK